MKPVVVVSRYHPDSFTWKQSEDGVEEPVLDAESERNDALDSYNHPRYRRALILREFSRRSTDSSIVFETPEEKTSDLKMYHEVQSERIVEFFETAWTKWDSLGKAGQDPMCNGGGGDEASSPALIPGNVPLLREPYQRPSQNVMGQIGFFCTDTCTPVFCSLVDELSWDAAVIEHAVASIKKNNSRVIYALATHPGHHAAQDSFGGYCYLNHSAMAARLLQKDGVFPKVAVLDVDYHCGNGTASIFYEDPSVLMISIHCNPDYDYPFHSGFEDETGVGEGEGTTLHLPLMPGTTWESYSVAMATAMDRIKDFGASAIVVSLGLDTHNGDPCAIRRAGFKLEGNDYLEMGKMIATANLPTIVVQEGGYKMDSVPSAAANVVLGVSTQV